MGQQQLLLLVLGIVIVGIAVVAGIQAFSEGKAKAQQDAAVSDAMRIISDVQAWYLKPQAFGGGGETLANFENVTLQALGYPVTAAAPAYQTVNGCFSITGATTGATIGIYQLATGADPETTQAVASCGGTQIASVDVVGAKPADIDWSYGTPD